MKLIDESQTTLSEEARKERNEYMKKYRKNNKDKIAEYNRTYWERKAKELQQEKEDN